MLHLRLSSGAPDEPDTGDWDAICATPGPRHVFAALFNALSGKDMPAPEFKDETESDVHRVHIFLGGDEAFGVKVTEIESAETSAFDMSCTWESFGLPGAKIIWKYGLEKAGQLGYAAYRHCSLVCDFASEKERDVFAQAWQKAVGKPAAFEPA